MVIKALALGVAKHFARVGKGGRVVGSTHRERTRHTGPENHGIHIPTQLTDIGNSVDDLSRSVVRQIGRTTQQRQEMDDRGVFLPRRLLHNLVIECGIRRPASNVRQSNNI